MSLAQRINVGILAHVDAGKTTLAEAILYKTGQIRSVGRVDHADAFLDTEQLEKNRGITIFSKMAQTQIGPRLFTLVDTPGHADFSAEMERTLSVLDVALLVISAADGVSAYAQVIRDLLQEYHVPVFVFVNKMDQPGADQDALMAQLKERFSEGCVDFTSPVDQIAEDAATEDEEAMEEFLEEGSLKKETLQKLILSEKIVPCLFGSALRMEGVDELLEALNDYVPTPEYPETFGARIYKILRDKKGNRLSLMKITGGSLKAKQVLTAKDGSWSEKADQLLVLSGAEQTQIPEAGAGSIVAVKGLTGTFAGERLGFESPAGEAQLQPVLRYAMILPEEVDPHLFYLKLKELEEEIPEMALTWEEHSQEILAKVMGEIQIEILKSLILERLDTAVEFGAGRIIYKETIEGFAEGIGHFEPLRHYAEVHLLLEQAPRGSGLIFDADCSTDELALNWQRLILTHLQEKEHVGVLTGSPITDMQITLRSGKAHLKHTEGGDFREATYRAVRQGLMKAKSVLLEPYFNYELLLPAENVGRAMTDITAMEGTCEGPEIKGELAYLTGNAPVSTMEHYQTEVTAYTGGRGHLTLNFKGYDRCHNPEEVLSSMGYLPEADLSNSPDSVFCSHGAGHVVPWNEVDSAAHLPSILQEKKDALETAGTGYATTRQWEDGLADEAELWEIFERTFGSIKKDRGTWKRQKRSFGGGEGSNRRSSAPVITKQYLLVDGYNIIFSWPELKELAKTDLEAARGRLMDILSNFQGFRGMTLILVFDAYKVPGGTQEVMKWHNIDVIYTKEAETADAYIEKTAHVLGKNARVTVATSDYAEQIIIFGNGAARMSARELHEEIALTAKDLQQGYLQENPGAKNYLFENLDEDLKDFLTQVRLGLTDVK